MRSGTDPAQGFDDLVQRDQVKLWASDADALAHLAVQTAHRHYNGEQHCVSVGTNDDAAAINEVVREQLVNAGAVDNTDITHGSDGLRIGAGDKVMTRHNNHTIGVANRMTWTVTGITTDGSVNLHHEARRQDTTVDPEYVQQYLHLAYATTVHGVQGETADHSDTVLSDQTDSPSLYVALTRGRHSNTIHITADTLDEAREQWVQAAGRNRADLGIDQARAAATAEALNYSPTTRAEAARPQAPAAKGRRASFAERMASVDARLTQELPSATIEDAAATEDEYLAEYETGNHQRPSGPRL
jgi:hypothetical protein